MLELISLEVTNRCGKACPFCYNRSSPSGATRWTSREVIDLARDCAEHGVRTICFGGGEPFEFDGLLEILAALRGVMSRSVTTSGLVLEGDELRPLPEATLDSLAAVAVDKIHVSIHTADEEEVDRSLAQLRQLEARAIRCGVNLLVPGGEHSRQRRAVERLRLAGVGNDRITYLPMRLRSTPTPEELADVAGRRPFQATSCLLRCAPSPRFCSIGADRSVAWCSYTTSRRSLDGASHAALTAALAELRLEPCGGRDAPRA
jgi:hypothetical protein